MFGKNIIERKRKKKDLRNNTSDKKKFRILLELKIL